jgi:hypothetical protein
MTGFFYFFPPPSDSSRVAPGRAVGHRGAIGLAPSPPRSGGEGRGEEVLCWVEEPLSPALSPPAGREGKSRRIGESSIRTLLILPAQRLRKKNFVPHPLPTVRQRAACVRREFLREWPHALEARRGALRWLSMWPEWRNGRRTGLNNPLLALSGHHTPSLATPTKMLMLN